MMTEFNHSPERDDEVLKEITDILERLSGIEYNKVHWLGDEVLLELIPLTKELMGITRKWRSKAMMRASKIEELTDKNKRARAGPIEGFLE